MVGADLAHRVQEPPHVVNWSPCKFIRCNLRSPQMIEPFVDSNNKYPRSNGSKESCISKAGSDEASARQVSLHESYLIGRAKMSSTLDIWALQRVGSERSESEHYFSNFDKDQSIIFNIIIN